MRNVRAGSELPSPTADLTVSVTVMTATGELWGSARAWIEVEV
jgi:hypothetical protein